MIINKDDDIIRWNYVSREIVKKIKKLPLLGEESFSPAPNTRATLQ